MIKPPKDDSEQLAMDAFKGLQPFTITINKPGDAMWLSMAMMNQMTGNKNLTDEALKLIIRHAKLVGAEAAVQEFFDQADEADISYPDFLKPVLLIMFTHMFENKEKIRKMVKKNKEKE